MPLVYDLNYILTPHRGAITDVAVSADGVNFITASADGTAAIYRLPGGDGQLPEPVFVKRLVGVHDRGLNCACTSKGRVALGGDDLLSLWDLRTGANLLKDSSHKACVSGVSLLDDYLLSSSSGEAVIYWDLRANRAAGKMRGHQGAVLDCCLFRHGATNAVYAATGGQDCSLKVWSPSTGICLVSANFGVPVSAVRAAANGEYLLVTLIGQGAQLVRFEPSGSSCRLITVRRFEDHSCAKYMLRSCFAMVEQRQLVACAADTGQFACYTLKKQKSNLLMMSDDVYAGKAVYGINSVPSQSLILCGGSSCRLSLLTLRMEVSADEAV